MSCAPKDAITWKHTEPGAPSAKERDKRMTTYVLVHGAWHRGELMEDVAEAIRAHGHDVYCPTLAGNRIGDAKDVGLDDAIASVSECLEDMVPPPFVDMFAQLEQEDGSILLPYPIWRDAFINDGDAELAQSAYDKLNPHPHKTFTDKISLKSNPATWQVGKSYIHCQEDVALPAALPWHPRLSDKLGLYRYVWMPGSHEVNFTNPTGLGEKIIVAGRD
jgi:hypothetical protein